MNEALDAARVLVSLSFLFYASWSDWKKREVSNWVWVVFAPIAFALTTIQYVLFVPYLLRLDLLKLYAFSFLFITALSIILFYAGAFGGADAKALICLSLALPYYPLFLLSSLRVFVSPLFPLSVFSNAVLLAALSVLYSLLRNSLWKLKTGRKLFEGFEKESKWRKILAFISGYKVDAAKLEKTEHLYPLEDISERENGSSERRLLTMPKDEKRDEIVERVMKAFREEKLQGEVWATPGLPLLIFITAGLIVALIYGDIVWTFLGSMLRLR